MRTWYFEDSEPVLDSQGNIKIIEGVDSLAENLDQRFLLFKGKYFLDNTAGVPYLEDILKKPIDPGLVASILNAEVLKEPEVTGIGAVTTDLDPNTRVFQYAVVVENSLGEPIEVTL